MITDTGWYYYQNLLVIFLLGKDHFMALKAHFLATGLTRIHKRSKYLPHNALSFVEIKNFAWFLNNYAERHAILLSGRIPGYKRDDIQLLLTCTTKKVIITTQLSSKLAIPMHSCGEDPLAIHHPSITMLSLYG